MRRMRRAVAALTLAATALTALVPAASAARPPAKQVYSITGTATADATATGVQLQVQNATRNALRVLDIGDAVSMTAGPNTRWVVVSGLVPSNATPDDIDAGDVVTVSVRAPRNSSLATLLATPAGRVADVTARAHPGGRPYYYVATVGSVDTVGKTISATVQDGNIWGLRSMLGAPVAQTFVYDAATVFVKGGPRLISAGALGPNDVIAIRSWAAPWTPVATVASTPAAHVRLIRDLP